MGVLEPKFFADTLVYNYLVVPFLHSRVSIFKVSEVLRDSSRLALKAEASRAAVLLSNAFSFLFNLRVSAFILRTVSLYSSTSGLRSFFSHRSLLNDMQLIVTSVGSVHA